MFASTARTQRGYDHVPGEPPNQFQAGGYRQIQGARGRQTSRRGTVCRETLLCIFILLSRAVAQPSQANQTSLEVYADAMKQPTVAEQINGLERYLAAGDQGVLKRDALEVLIWDYMRMGSLQRVQQRATELEKMDPGNAVAIAALGEQSEQGQKHSDAEARYRIRASQAALQFMEGLKRPEGMLAGDFAALRRRVESRLNGMLGLAYVSREQYRLARTPLQQAVAVDPENPQYAYALGLALLNGRDPADAQNAFIYLARAANLTKGTPSGQQIAEYARKQYRKAGGSAAEWNGYLAAAVVPDHAGSSAAVVAGNAPASPTTAANGNAALSAASVGNANMRSGSTNVASGNSPAVSSSAPPAGGNPSTTSSAANGSSTGAATSAPTRKSAKLAPPALPPSSIRRSPEDNANPLAPPEAEPRFRVPYTPASLAILIETSLLTKENRPVIISTLREVVSHLRGEDEAAILVFSDQLDFEQDLTENDRLLEQAINELRPRRSKALMDGITFAAGHLKRIGKNSNRVLLVVSDGRSGTAKQDSTSLSTQVSGVRIDCIGLNADGADQRAVLERLASYTGGQAGFAHGPEQFRTVALQMTGFLGTTNR
jgi:tetratricopeptide (TPR) repeat protein